MSGHSKWSNIKHRKQAVDAHKSQKFQKLAKEIRMAVLSGGIDLKKNSLLRTVIQKAKTFNMAKSVIERAINSAAKNLTSQEESFWWGGKFLKNVFLLFRLQMGKGHQIKAINELKKVVSKSKTEILPLSSLLHFFDWVISVDLLNLSEKTFLELTVNFNIDKFIYQKEKQTLYFSDSKNYKKFQNYALENGIKLEKVEQTYLPKLKLVIDSPLKKELMTLKEIVLSKTSCNLIVDNLE